MVSAPARSDEVALRETAPAGVRGRVFLDQNRNGKLDANEQGVARVPVTDGIQFVLTAADGSYEFRIADDPLIPHKPARTVSISWPSGTWPTAAWFRRLSDLRDGEPVDFGLREEEQKLPFWFLHVSDNHDQGHGYERFGSEVKKLGERVKFCVNTGDLLYANYGPTFAECEKSFRNYAANRSRMPVPLFETIGNHDYTATDQKGADTRHPFYACGLWTRHVGPVRWSFNYGGVHFVGLDWAYLDGSFYASGVGDVTLAWLEKDLELLPRGTRTVAFAHYPSGTERFWPTLAQNRVKLALGGHSHKHKVWAWQGVRAATTINLFNRGCTLCIVDDRDIHLVNYCPDCKENHHSKRCALSDQRLQEFVGRRENRSVVEMIPLADAARKLDRVGSSPQEIRVEIEPQTARRAGVRLSSVRNPDAPAFEIAFEGNELWIDGVALPFERLPDDRNLELRLILENGSVEVIANRRIRFVKAWSGDGPGVLTLFARQGGCLFRQVESWSLKPKS
jgi:hypothetical protein